MKDSNSKRPRVSVELVKQAKKGEATPGIYRDAKGVGLVLKIEEPGAHAPEGAVGGPARWVLRTTIKGKRRDLGLGSIKDVTLAEARGRADELRKEARAGKDPTAKPKAALAFADAAKKVHAMHKHSWKNGKHVDQWINTIKQYANPKIGQKDVSEIDASDVLAVLNPIWQKKAETARRLRQRIALCSIGRKSKATATRRWQMPPTRCAPSCPSRRCPRNTMRPCHGKRCRNSSRLCDRATAWEGCRLALEFVTLTAARTGETLKATWPEFDLEAKVWIVPASRMKAKKAHRVPLSDQAVALLTTTRALWPHSALVFPGRYGKQLSDMAILMCMRRLEMGGTPHGLRSSSRDWCADKRKDDGSPRQRWPTRSAKDRARLQAHGPFRGSASAHAGMGRFRDGEAGKGRRATRCGREAG
jgi:integrase